MAKDRNNQGGPTMTRKDEATDDRSHQNAESREQLQERSLHGARRGIGQRNGSSKKK